MTSEIAVRPEPSRFFRWLVLVFISLAMFGNYYVYDCISPIGRRPEGAARLLATRTSGCSRPSTASRTSSWCCSAAS